MKKKNKYGFWFFVFGFRFITHNLQPSTHNLQPTTHNLQPINIFLFLLLLSVGQRVDASNIVYDKTDSTLVTYLLEEAATMPRSSNFTLHFARSLIGVKYENYILEQTQTEQLIVDLRHLDCTTFVETVAALSICAKRRATSFADYCRTLRTLRYRDGIITDYSSRLHYFTDWIRNNQQHGFVEWIQSPNPPFTEQKICSYWCMTRLKHKYKQLVADPTLVPKIAKCEENLRGTPFRYIPKSLLNGNREQLSCINDGDIICMVSSAGILDVAHLGFAVWHGEELHMIDASMIHRKVVEEEKSMFKYQAGQPGQIGILVVKLKK